MCTAELGPRTSREEVNMNVIDELVDSMQELDVTDEGREALASVQASLTGGDT
jgi:hypothetical protein